MKPNRFSSLGPGAILPREKKPKPTKRSKTPEAVIQGQVEAYIRLRGLASFHIPDALLKAGFAHGQAINGALINAAREVRGFPDLLVFDPERHGLVLALELKTSVGKMTDNQRDWQRVLGTKLCRSLEEAKAEIDRWLADPAKYWEVE